MAPAPAPSRAGTFLLGVTFAILIVVPLLYDALRVASQVSNVFSTSRAVATLRRQVSDRSFSERRIRTPYQVASSRLLSQGTRSVLIAPGGWLFYRQDLEFCASSGFLRGAAPEQHFSTKTIRDVDTQLKARHVHLVVVPVPIGPAIYPERMWPAYPVGAGFAGNVDIGRWRQALRDAGVDVVDLDSVLWNARNATPDPLYLSDNTHWTARAGVLAADAVAAHVRPFVSDIPQISFARRAGAAPVGSDLLDLMGLPQHTSIGQPADPVVRYEEVLRPGAPSVGLDSDPVFLAGDSFSRIYTSGPGPHAAGLPDGLMFALGVGVQRVVRDGATPGEMVKELAARGALLEHKRVVVWEFAERLLLPRFSDNWQATDLNMP